MKFYLSKISYLEEDDIGIIEGWIKDFFPYVNLPREKISEKMMSENFVLIKSHQKNIVTGFVELEFLKSNEARMNAVFVEEAWRGQRLATKLMHRIIHEAKRKKHLHKLFLLVKESNFPAKNLYRKSGFEFEKEHEKEIDGNKVEVWSMYVH